MMLAASAAEAVRSFNPEQLAVYDRALRMVADAEASHFSTCQLLFVDAPGGTGKTYVSSAICASLISKRTIVLATASSGMERH